MLGVLGKPNVVTCALRLLIGKDFIKEHRFLVTNTCDGLGSLFVPSSIYLQYFKVQSPNLV